MAVRSMKLKLMTRSGAESENLRRGLWKAHQMMNEGIAYYMNWLVLMRQESIWDWSKAEVKLELISLVRRQQELNGWIGEKGPDDQILTLLRQLYELVVPSSVGQNGDAQMLARKFLSPLVDPESEGGERNIKSRT